jgi:glycerol-3-phosphate dehydrogenase (NAD(P)+)
MTRESAKKTPSRGLQEAGIYARVAVVGAGAWGTALASVAAGSSEVVLWARETAVIESIRARRENELFLSGVKLPPRLSATADILAARDAEAVLVAAPAQHLRSVLAALRPAIKGGVPVVLCAKGIELETGLLLTEVLAEVLPGAEPAILSGPSFARDVARGLPTAVTIAARDRVAARLVKTLGRPSFRPYASEDLVGVALGGAAKNVYAIASGMVEGAGLGESARAATISRGFAELLRLGAELSAKSETLMGLSGLGDLVLTATSPTSRNFALGLSLGRGEALARATSAGRPLAEGAATAPALVARARRHGVELPIAEAVADVLSGNLGVKQVAERLLSRPFKAE